MLKLDNQNQRRAALLFILATGLLFRVWGLDWGLPEKPNIHPDEHDYVIQHALKVSWAHPDPGWYSYPSFIMYLVSLTFGLLKMLGLASQDWQAYLIGRCWSAAFGTATIWAVYRLARALRAEPAGALLAALWTALLPLHVWESHTAITDPLMTFWTVMTLWMSVRLVGPGRWKDYLRAGACLGLATGSKYTAAIAVVAIVVAAFLSRRKIVETVVRLAGAGAAALLCAFIVMPFSFIRLKNTLAAMSFEHRHTERGHFGFGVPADGWQYHRYLYQLVAAWPFSLGLVLYASAVLGVVWALFRLDRARAVVLAFAAVFVGILGSWHFTPLRYYLPLVVLGALFAGLFHCDLLAAARPARRRLGVALAVATFGYTLLFTAQTTARFAHDTRIQAEHWLDETLKPGQTLALGAWRRYAALPVANTNGITILGGRNETYVFDPRLLATDFDLIEISSLHFSRHYRNAKTKYGEVAAYESLRHNPAEFELVKTFDAPFINKSFYAKLDPMFGGYFISPTLEFYRPLRRSGSTPARSAR